MVVALLANCAVSALRAQTISASGGTSTFLDASGFEVDYKWMPVSGWVGLGLVQGTHFGGFLGTTYRGYDLGFGDRYIPFVLDTDVFDHSYYFYGRGVSVSQHTKNQQWLAFAGTSALPVDAPFLRAYETGTATSAFFYERRYSPRVVFHSLNIFRDQVTSIQSLGVTLNPHWKVAAAGGVGANAGFLSGATDYDHRWVKVTSSYTVNGAQFQRFRIPNLFYPERTGGNVRVQLSPLPNLGMQLGHETILSPILGSQNSLRAWVNTASAYTSWEGISMNASASESKGGPFSTSTRIVNASRKLGERIRVFGAGLRIRTQGSSPSTLLLLTGEEKVNPRLSLRQTLTQGSGIHTLGWGGGFLSNPLSLDIDYQTIFSPVAGAFGGRAFVQAWTVNLRLQMPKGIGFHYQTFVDPFGKFRYTAFLSGVGYNGEGAGAKAPSALPANLGRYVIRGVVRDERGQPVWGIAIQIDGQFVYSDDMGEFFIRVPRRSEYPLKIANDRCLSGGPWEIVSAPTRVMAEPAASAKSVQFVVRRSAVKPRAVEPTPTEHNP